ncbi:BQ5605_C009g05642 [Microbotryum silenes-dioicae]|uniref:Protoheme IX farnesyltransferase, mitochondrial n=1 Tax=Microbotryum silenes-dioicae TaxID=796604 RepID=A0A2X0MIB9_9BASI|nr:BQ5605_C009g05642 [Microbotryum silenes-dioicae]
MLAKRAARIASCSTCRSNSTRALSSTSHRITSSRRPSPSSSVVAATASTAAWKGKARASDELLSRWASTSATGATASTSPIRAEAATTAAAAAAATGSSSHAQSPSVVYAHDDLLSRTPTTASTANRRRKSRRDADPNRAQQDYFSPSYLREEEPPLQPPSTSPLVPLANPIPKPHPPTVLSNGLPNPEIRWRSKAITSVSDDWALYKSLSKARLSAFTVLTAMAGYAMCPVDPSTTTAAMEAFAQSIASTGVSLQSLSSTPTTAALSSSPANDLTLSVLLPMTVGTALCSASAASLNELIEAPYDAQMARTRARPLPKRQLTPLHVATFGALTGTIGVGTLFVVNPLAGSIGLGTILLYCPLYTIAKRHTVYNTWLGAIVGALPPMIGWAACTSSIAPTTQPGAWALFFVLYAWQFPHFNSLAYTLRSAYASSGYRMLAVLDPAKNALVSLRYSLALLPMCWSFPLLGLTNPWFAFLATVPNGAMAWAAWKFWRRKEERNAKVLFWASLVHLPVVLGMAMLCKKGLWGSNEMDEEAVVVDAELERKQANEAARLV